MFTLFFPTVRASSYDVMLHRDSRFWEVISKRNEAHAKEEAVSHDPMYGPTVGRRREFGKAKKEEEEGEKAQSPALQTFSIGNEFDFLPSDDPKPAAAKPPQPPKKDSLMEALMGALNEDGEDGNETETIVFQSASGEEAAQQKTSSAPSPTGVPPSENTDATPAAASEKTESVVDSTASAAGSDDKSGLDDMDALWADANMNLDEDMDALLAGVGDGVDGLGDDMDAELEDLENFLSQK